MIRSFTRDDIPIFVPIALALVMLALGIPRGISVCGIAIHLHALATMHRCLIEAADLSLGDSRRLLLAKRRKTFLYFFFAGAAIAFLGMYLETLTWPEPQQ